MSLLREGMRGMLRVATMRSPQHISGRATVAPYTCPAPQIYDLETRYLEGCNPHANALKGEMPPHPPRLLQCRNSQSVPLQQRWLHGVQSSSQCRAGEGGGMCALHRHCMPHCTASCSISAVCAVLWLMVLCPLHAPHTCCWCAANSSCCCCYCLHWLSCRLRGIT
jgi:hypothetical protein